ncbi:hypothetical protein VaNZ11_015852, partial [Volvox africanus]
MVLVHKARCIRVASAAQVERLDALRDSFMVHLKSAINCRTLSAAAGGSRGGCALRHGAAVKKAVAATEVYEPVRGPATVNAVAAATTASPQVALRKYDSAGDCYLTCGGGDNDDYNTTVGHHHACRGRVYEIGIRSGGSCWRRLSSPRQRENGGIVDPDGGPTTAVAVPVPLSAPPGSSSSSSAAFAMIAAAAFASGSTSSKPAGEMPSSPPSVNSVTLESTEANIVTRGGCSGSSSGPSATITHLIVMANGLFGSPSNWSVICEQLGEHLDMSTVVLHPSKVNRLTDTYDGIDVCGQRLADEIRSVAAAHPSLQRISVIGHSMGGLLLRYAIGVLYNPSTGRIAGLQASHFITLATPHVGCDGEGLAQVPFIGWISTRPVQHILQALSVPTATLMFRRTGRQFFLADGSSTSNVNPNSKSSIAARSSSGMVKGGRRIGSGSVARDLRAPTSSPALVANAAAVTGPPSVTLQPQTQAPSRIATTSANDLQTTASTNPKAQTAVAVPATDTALPLLYRMTHDEPERGLYFYSALASFASRTAYANTDGDHLVGWANSSLRFLHQLPRLPPETARARGVVMQDPLLAAFSVRGTPEAEPQRASDCSDLPIDFTPVDDAEVDAARGEKQNMNSTSTSTSTAGTSNGTEGGRKGAAHMGDGSAGAAEVLRTVGDRTEARGEGATAGDGVSSVAMTAATAAIAEVMLRRLQRLPWRRIDVSFQGARLGFAHNNIQVTRRWLNFEGITVAHHLARQVVALEAEWARMQRMATTQVAAVAPTTVAAMQKCQQSGVSLQLQSRKDLQQQQMMSPSGALGLVQLAKGAEGAPVPMT